MTSINLRAIEPGDIDLIFQWENDKSIWHLSNTIAPFSRYVLTKYIDSAHLDIYQTRQLRLMIDYIDSGVSRTVGAIDLFDFEPFHLRAGIGVVIGDIQDRGKGIASLALDQLIVYTFETLQLKQVYCNILEDNQASLKLFEKHGFRQIGLKKSWVKTNDGFKDEYMLQLVK